MISPDAPEAAEESAAAAEESAAPKSETKPQAQRSRRFRVFPPVHREGWKFVIIVLVAALAGAPFWLPSLALGAVLAAAVALFFRDPERTIPLEADVAVAPADGVVCAIGEAAAPSESLAPDEPSVPQPRICIFMSVLDIHINRAPVQAQVRAIAYRPGAFFNASLDKASERNERQTWTLTDSHNDLWRVAQIAGLIARRIVGFAVEDDALARGERLGIIRFGSRVDTYLPKGWEVCVREGQRAIGGETIIARRTELAS